MHDTLTALIANYGYYIVFALVAVESFGIPLPGETSLVTASAFMLVFGAGREHS